MRARRPRVAALPPNVIEQPTEPLNPQPFDMWAFPVPPALRYFDGQAWRQTDRNVPGLPPIIAIPYLGNYPTGIWFRGFTQLGGLVAFK